MPSTRGTEPKDSVPSSLDPDATVVMPVVEVKPLSQKTDEAHQRLIEEAMATCSHLAWETGGEALLPGGLRHEHRKCGDCGHRWTVTTKPEEPTEEEWEAVKPEPPKVVYGGGRIVTYQTKHGQHDLVVDELAIVTIQAGLLVVQHVESQVTAIVGVRPWMQEEVPHADAAV